MLNLRKKAIAKFKSEDGQSVSHKIAELALSMKFEDLPTEVIHMAKRCLLDTIGCAIGGHQAPGRAICEQTVYELGGREEATIIGSGYRTNVLNATMVNSFMVRYLDYNDLGGGGHNSDAIPALLATAEAYQKSGKDLITSIVFSYEIGQRWIMAAHTKDLYIDYKRVTDSGWCMDVRGGINVPPALGLLMDLDKTQIASAIGATVVRSNPMNHLDADKEDYVMSKNLRFGFVAHDAIMSCKLAKNGFTGPPRAIEGQYGYKHTIMQNVFNVEILYAPIDQYQILSTSFKPLCVNYTTQSSVQCTIALVKEHDIQAEDIENIHLTVGKRESMHTTAPRKKYPQNGETADHSLYYANALAAKERSFGPTAFKEEKYNDPMVLDLTERITYEVSDKWGGFGNGGTSKITLKNGDTFEKSIDVPHGYYTDPLSDAELEAKFRQMADTKMSVAQVNQLIDTIWAIDSVKDINAIMPLMIFGENI